jgi:deoxyribonuclease-4
MPHFGYHFDPPLATIPTKLAVHHAATFQTTLRDPMRLSKTGIPDEADQAAYRAAALAHFAAAQNANAEPLWGMVHASLITNLASPDARIRHGSLNALVSDANLAASLGMAGVCFHGGYQKGHATRQEALDVLVAKLSDVLTKLKPGASVWLENSCEGTELGQTIEEIGQVFQAVKGDPSQLGFVLDTCHLHVAGFDLADGDAPQRLADSLDAAGLTPHLCALHLNDAREECGSHRDRHAVPGQGTINTGLLRLCAHPLFAPLPAILELGTPDAAAGIAYLQGGG